MRGGARTRIVAAAFLAVCAVFPLSAEHVGQRLVEDAEAARWRAVGSLRVAGRPSCTAVLISGHEAITAAHCVVDRASGRRIAAPLFTLVLGQRTDGFAAVRRVAVAAFLPGFVSPEPITDLGGLSSDLALLVLDQPVAPDEVTPLQVTDWPDRLGAFVDIVGYERDGSKSATIREGCMAIDDGQGVTVLTCDVITGISGAPVLLSARPEDPPQLVAAVSSRGDHTALVVAIAPRLAELRDLVAGQARRD